MARGKLKKNRIRAKRFESEIVQTCDQIFDAFDLKPSLDAEKYQKAKQCVGKFIKRLIDTKLLREQDFYVGDWVFPSKDQSLNPVEIVDINYSLKTARIRDKKEGEIWVRFQDIVKDDDFYYPS